MSLKRRVFAAANTLRFSGAEHITAALFENQQSTAEEIVFRFKTEKPSRPIFSSHPDKLIRASLEDGKFKVVYSFSNKNASQVSCSGADELDDSRCSRRKPHGREKNVPQTRQISESFEVTSCAMTPITMQGASDLPQSNLKQ